MFRCLDSDGSGELTEVNFILVWEVENTTTTNQGFLYDVSLPTENHPYSIIYSVECRSYTYYRPNSSYSHYIVSIHHICHSTSTNSVAVQCATIYWFLLQEEFVMGCMQDKVLVKRLSSNSQDKKVHQHKISFQMSVAKGRIYLGLTKTRYLKISEGN